VSATPPTSTPDDPRGQGAPDAEAAEAAEAALAHGEVPDTQRPFVTDAAAPMDVRARRFRARDAILTVLIAAIIVLVATGPSIRRTGNRMDPGFERDMVLAVGKPAGAVADWLPFHGWADTLTGWLAPDSEVGGEGAFATTAVAGTGAGAIAPVGPEAFDPRALGVAPAPRRPLRTLLVTGDSMTMPPDAELARRLASREVDTTRDPHIGTGISKSDLLDWGALSRRQARQDRADAVVVFIGANEGFPLPSARGGKPVECCGPAWAAAYATRVRTMMNTYRRNGASRVYWLQLPLPRDGDRREIARTVNAAIAVAAEPYRSQVRVLDLASVFTPGGRYRVSMPIDGRDTIVRKPDGVHLSDAGAQLAADLVQRDLERDFR
jgi:lysophospholipase L1-like esterase